MKKIKSEQRRLNLNRETLRQLEAEDLQQANGGVDTIISGSNPFCDK